MISVKNLSKSFGRTVAVNDVSFDVAGGEVLGFLGPNGAGKTTTMRILTCYLTADQGEVTVAGHDIYREPVEVRRRIGYLPENNPLYLDLEVSEYLSFVGSIRNMPKGAIPGRLGEIVEICGLAQVKGRIIAELSKGFRQRVGLAQALIHDPDILVLDEPTVGLDPSQIIEIRDLIRNIGREKTVILSSHILPEVEATCQRVLIINEGKIVGQGTPGELAAQSRGSGIVHVLVRGPQSEVEKALAAVAGVEKCLFQGEEDGAGRFLVRFKPGEDSREQLAVAVAAGGWGLRELIFEKVTLEDVFLDLTSGEGK